MRAITWLGADLKFAARLLRKSPALSLIAVVALAIGTGFTSTIFAIVDGALLEGLPFQESEELMNVVSLRPATGATQLVAREDLIDWRERQTSFEALGAWMKSVSILTTPDGNQERMDTGLVSSEIFSLLEVSPILGRDFTKSDEREGAEPVIMLSHGLWQNRFRGDPGVVGKTVMVEGVAHRIVGVMPKDFAFPIREEVWIPVNTVEPSSRRGEGQRYFVLGRLRDGVSEGRARSELSTIARALALDNPETNRGLDVKLGPYVNEVVGERLANLSYTMLAAVLGVLLIACANVANLQMARAALRTKEVAARFALGASRARVVSQLLAESLLLSGVGALAGLLIARVRIAQFNEAIQSAPMVPFWLTVELDWGMVGFTMGLALVSTLASGCLPAFQASRTDLNEILKTESRTSSSLRLGRFSKSLVVGELALSCSLLIGAGLMIRSVVELEELRLGFATEDVLTARVALTEPDFPDPESWLRVFDELVPRLQRQPGVEAVALTSHLPGMGSGGVIFNLEGESRLEDAEESLTRRAFVSPGFFEAFGAQLLDGRGFRTDDDRNSHPVAIVNQSFADRYLPDKNALGQRLLLKEGERERSVLIVGLAPDLAMNRRHPGSGIVDEDPAGLYLPLRQMPSGFMGIALRTSRPPLELASALRREVEAVAGGAPLYEIQSLANAIRDSNVYYRLVSESFLVFGFSALFLASIGLYGVTAFSVNRRAQELGIRTAMGAAPFDLLGMILKQGLRQLAIGLAIGIALALMMANTLEVSLFGVKPWDPFVFAAIVLTLTLVGTLACLLPARRASRVDPIAALRDE